MTARRALLLAGVAALLISVVALMLRVSTSDGKGGSIGCGNAVSADMSAAQNANNSSVAGIPILNEVLPHADFVAQCQSAVSARRGWSIPVAVVGLLAAGGSMLVGGRPDTRIGQGR